MNLDPDVRRQLEDSDRRLSRGLVLALVLGSLALLGLLMWFLRMSGGIWS